MARRLKVSLVDSRGCELTQCVGVGLRVGYISGMSEETVSYKSQSDDTTEAVDRLMFEAYARMSADEKLHCVRDLNRTCKILRLTGFRADHPDASEDELRARWAATFLDEKTVFNLFGFR